MHICHSTSREARGQTEGVGSFPSTMWVLGTELRLAGLVLSILTRCVMLTVSIYNLYTSDNVDASGLKRKVTGHDTIFSVLVTLHNKVGII